MSTFEFVLVSFAILLGFGISEILAGWGAQLRARRRLAPYPLQIASSAFILYFHLQYLWMMWLARDIEWTFPVYLGMAAPALAMSLAGQAMKIDTSVDALPVRDQYFQNSRVAYSLLATFPALALLGSFFTNRGDILPDPPNLFIVSTVRVMVLAVWASMAWSKSERLHWIGLGIVWLTAAGFIARLGFRLTGST